MYNIRQYVISIIAMSILCGIVGVFFQDSTHKGVIKMITGLMLTVVVLKPVLWDAELNLRRFWEYIPTDSTMAVQAGIDVAVQENSAYIKQTTESYIISKAKEMGADVSAEVELENEDAIKPVSVRMSGNASPYIKAKLENWIQINLGIPEERQEWI